ncbi:protein kinase domain-containing protein [Actinoplanes sp. NPDC026623]|uniref:protein kinase domain-containing protein n=1 Tax=Actinoplanes sp. NPDC026623 TaxID=3155610 RepID=UPI0033C95A2B
MERDTCTVRVPTGYRVGGWCVGKALASGSWSSVYRAARVGAGVEDQPREAALKFIATGTLTARQLSHLADMTSREVAVHRHVEHPGLIRVLDVLVIDDPANPALDGGTVLALELAAGSAAAALDRAGGAGLREAPRIIAETCAALAYLHRAGWVHGDLKPSNILLMPDGSVRLADFGLAAHLDGTHAYLPPGGTSDFVPPERWAEPVRPRGTPVRQTADLWALGISACLLLTGRLPFPGVTSRARAAAAAGYASGRAALNLPDVLTEPWRRFIADCLAPDHASRKRYDAATMHRRVLEIVASPGGGRPGPLRRALASRPGVAAAVGLLGAAGITLAVLWPRPPAGQPVPQASAPPPGYDRYFRTDAGIPPAYYELIVRAGVMCPENKAVTPWLVAALLKAESNFDAGLSDPAADEYGIARWTPAVLKFYLPPGERDRIPPPPFPPEVSIPAVGRYLCSMAPALEEVPGSPEENLAAAYRTSADVVRAAGGVPRNRPKLTRYIERLRAALTRYRPVAPFPSAS